MLRVPIKLCPCLWLQNLNFNSDGSVKITQVVWKYTWSYVVCSERSLKSCFDFDVPVKSEWQHWIFSAVAIKESEQ